MSTVTTPRHTWVKPLLAITVLALCSSLTGLLPETLVPWQVADAGTLALGVFLESFPFVVLGVLAATAVQLWVPPQLLLRLLPRRTWLRRCTLSLCGIILPVCECGNVPVARALLARGLSPAEAITFVLAAPLLNPVTILTTYQAFGWQDGILLARICGGFFIANLLGYLFARAPQDLPLLTAAVIAAPNADSCHSGCNQQHSHTTHWITRGTAVFTNELYLLLPVLAIGSVLAGIIQAATPQELLHTLGSHPVYSVLVLLLLAALVSICSTVDAFFMLSFSSVFSAGAIATFLVFGALIDVKMLLLLRTTFTRITLLIITAVAALSSLLLGLAVNLIV